MQKKFKEITPQNIADMAEQMAQYVHHQSLQHNVPLHYIEEGELAEQLPTGEKREIPLTVVRSQTA